jgi:hypothetical protein
MIAKTLLPVGAVLLSVILTESAVAASPSGEQVSVQIDWQPTPNDPEDAVWIAYLLARTSYIDSHKGAYGWKPGTITPSFAEEVAAREGAIVVYHELKQKDGQLNVAYFEDLQRVADASYVSEYVWTYLHQAEWGFPPDTLHLVEFMRWRARHLSQHAAKTRGRIAFVVKGKEVPETPQAWSEMPLLVQGRKVLEKGGDPRLAIAGYFDPVIEHFARSYSDAGTRFYGASNPMQMIMYTALPNEDKKRIEVLDSTWPDAYLLKAYALNELKLFDDARAALEKAVSLSPLKAQYLSELAYTYQAQGECDRSIELYEQAASAAEMGSEDSTKTADLTLAWRGQGYCLVEQGKLDEAEALYRKCLKLDPSDAKAKSELRYVQSKRKQ